jgi:MFS family permease
MTDAALSAESVPARTGMRTFLLIWLGQLFSILGSGLSSFALGVWIYQQTGQATPFALTVLFGSLPRLLVMPFAGSLADRWNRRLIMILADTGAALGTVALAVLLFFGDLQVWHIYIIVVFSSMFSAFQEPAYMASVTMLVPKKDFGRANGMMQMGQAIGSIITPLLAGILFVSIGLQGIILIDLGTFFVAVTPLLLVRIPQPKLSDEADGRKKNAFQDFALGWKFVSTLAAGDCRRCGRARRIRRTWLMNDRSTAFCQVLSSNDSKAPAGGPPALVTKISKPPSARTVSATSRAGTFRPLTSPARPMT